MKFILIQNSGKNKPVFFQNYFIKKVVRTIIRLTLSPLLSDIEKALFQKTKNILKNSIFLKAALLVHI